MGILQWFDRMMAPEDLPAAIRARALRCETLRYPANGNVVHVVGGSHLNPSSCRDVQRVVDFARPQSVLLELCAERVGTVQHMHRYIPYELPQLTIANVPKLVPFITNPLFWVKTLPTLRLEAVLGINEGAEQATAVHEAAKHHQRIYVQAIDAPSSMTIMKVVTSLWQKVGPVRVAWDFYKTEVLGTHVYPAIVKLEEDMKVLENMMAESPDAKLTPDQVRRMQQLAHNMTAFEWDWGALLEALKGTDYLEGIIKPLIEERDTVLAHQIYSAARTQRCAVAVVGAAHVAGITAKFGKTRDEDVARILEPPTRDFYSVCAQLAALSMVSPAAVFYTRYRCKKAGGRAWQYFRYARYVGVGFSSLTSSYVAYQMYNSYTKTRNVQVRFREFRERMVREGKDPMMYRA